MKMLLKIVLGLFLYDVIPSRNRSCRVMPLTCTTETVCPEVIRFTDR